MCFVNNPWLQFQMEVMRQCFDVVSILYPYFSSEREKNPVAVMKFQTKHRIETEMDIANVLK